MIRFERVSFEEYLNYYRKIWTGLPGYLEENYDGIYKEWQDIKLPKRSTRGSAGYDFYSPMSLTLQGENSPYITIPTGVRFVTDRDDIFLMCVPRSGLGFKYQMNLANTTGIIDSDYWYSDNSGHILAKINSKLFCEIQKGQAFMQGIIVPYIKTDDDESTEDRNGGFGSTDKK